jgi:uncharacterized protein (TIGR03067 family)
MGLWGALKKLWHWLRCGSGFGVEELARRLEWDAAELSALQPNYREFLIPKRSGGQRRLCAPDDQLKDLQRRILHRLLRRLRCHPAATGFQCGESIVTHARRHAGRAVVVRLDLKDFFPSTGAARVYAYFRRIGWNRPASRLLTRLCTHQGGLPQGAPTSPRLSNLLNYRLDRRLDAMARKLGAWYSRYADDITLSFPEDNRKQVRYLIRFVRRVAYQQGYRVHDRKKLLIRRRHQQQCVTGLVVNEGVQLPRAVRRRLRAVEHHMRTGRPATLTPEQLAGWRALQHMVAVQAADPVQQETVRREREALQGTWVLTGGEEQGQPLPTAEAATAGGGLKWIVRADRLVFELENIRVEAAYRLGPRATPRTIDLTPTSGPDQGRRFQGIYALDGDRLTVCLNNGRGQRPGDFSAPADSGAGLFLLQRQG